MGEKLDEGLLFDLLEKRRAGKFTGDELLFAADHPEVIRWAMARPKVVAGIKRLMEREALAIGVFKVTVNYDLSLKGMIAAGHYNSVDGNIIADHFPPGGKVNCELVLLPLRKRVVSGMDEIDLGCHAPARIEHLLVFGAKFPDVQRQFPIIALGCQQGFPGALHWRPCPCLCGDALWRHLTLCQSIPEVCRVLAIRKAVRKTPRRRNA